LVEITVNSTGICETKTALAISISLVLC
jgi:hypothetical protein